MRWFSQNNRRQTQYLDWFLIGVVVSSLILLTCSQSNADPAKKECGERQHKCICGTPRCIDQELVKNGVQDCQDGSDEGQWDPSKCAIKNKTSEDIRFKRAALSELSRVTNLGATTTFFGGDRGRTRPVGLLTTTMGSFVTSGTTTEYITKVLATYIKGTYARIISTSSRIYHAIPTDGVDMVDAIKPTGFIASTVSNEINGYATTAHTTDFYRTYIDGTYAQLVSSYSNIHYPPWYTDKIVATAVASQPPSEGPREPIYATPVVEKEQTLQSEYLFEDPGARVKTIIVPTRVVPQVQNTLLPENVRGRFDNSGRNIVAEIGVIENESQLKGFRPNNHKDTEVKVTGTHGKFVHSDSHAGDETTYNVFTGTYVQNSKTFLFFFGNTVIDPSKTVNSPTTSIQIENGPPQGNNVVLDMNRNLKVIVPSNNERIPIQGSIEGKQMDGVLVEIESSEPGDYITVDGARQQIDHRTPSDPRIDQITVTLGKNDEQPESSTTSRSASKSKVEDENEIPTGRKVPSSGEAIQPSSAKQISLPTFTVGQDNYEPIYDTTIASIEKDPSEVGNGSGEKKKSAPVFNRPTPRPALAINRAPAAQAYRSHRAFVDLVDSENDLQSAATTGRATVTYVGFADFTTTVGNTVIIFMPRTKIVEAIQASSTQSPTVEPTRFVYHTTEETEEEEVPVVLTSEKPVVLTSEKPEEEPERTTTTTSTTTTTQKNIRKESENVLTTTPKTPQEQIDEDEDLVAPSESTTLISGTKTIFVGQSNEPSVAYEAEATPQLPSSSVLTSPTPSRKTIFPSRSRFIPKHLNSLLQSSSSGVSSSEPELTPSFTPQGPLSSGIFATATTAIYQTDRVKPTGLISSIASSVVKDKTTTFFTTLVYGTYIKDSYAQIIKSTSSVLLTQPSNRFQRPAYSSIRPSKSVKHVPSTAIVTYEVTTTERVTEDEVTTEPNIVLQKQTERVETSTSSSTTTTTEASSNKPEEREPETTTSSNVNDDEYDEVVTTTSSSSTSTTTPKTDDENEIETGRKVLGRPQEQVLVNEAKPSEVEPTEAGEHDDEQTIYITRTVPTTLYRTYTYFTTFFIPNEDSTITSVTSREETSTAVGVVKKTFTSLIPTTASESLTTETVEGKVKPSKSVEEEIDPSSVRIFYKTFFTTYTYLTTFFTGQTSSISSREEVVSDIVTLTQSAGKEPAPPTSSIKIVPTSSEHLHSHTLKSTVIRSPVKQASASRSGKFSVIRRSKILSRTPALSSSVVPTKEPEPSSEAEEVEPTASAALVTATVYKTFFTTYTYFTTLFNGEDTSIKSRTEVITNVVPTVTRIDASSIAPSTKASDDSEDSDTEEDDSEHQISSSSVAPAGKETTFYTTYTYLTTFFKDGTEFHKSSLATYTKVQIGDNVIRSGLVSSPGKIEPTKLSGRNAPRASASVVTDDDDDDLNEVGSHLSETSETTLRSSQDEEVTTEPSHNDYYELDASEGTTLRSVYDEEESKSTSSGSDDNEVHGTPELRTYFTTFTFYTTFYKGGSSTVSSRLETVTNVVSDAPEASAAEAEAITAEPTYPITYYTTFTYWTTSFHDGTPVVTSREETVSNVVTPGVDDIAPSSSPVVDSKVTEVQPTSTAEVELTTHFTTYTYYTTSYLKDETVVTSRLETVTNIITGSPGGAEVTATAAGRAIGSIKPEILTNEQLQSDDDYDLPTGLLSSIISSEVVDQTTTVHSTDVYGTYIDGIYAQVLESTSELIRPTASLETSFVQGATEIATGLVSVNEGKTVDGDGQATTFYTTKAFGTVIDGSYAHLLDKTSSVLKNPDASLEPSENILKTGLVRIVDGSLVEGESTTYYSSKILGTFIDNQYAQVIESTSRIVVNPTSAEDVTTTSPSRLAELEGSEDTTEEIPTTTVKTEEEDKDDKKGGSQRRFPLNRSRGSNRLSFTATSKSFTPLITPFASRSRPAFAPRRRQSSAIVVSRTDVTPTVTATLAAGTSSSSRNTFANRRRPGFRGSDGDAATTPASLSSSTVATQEATPRLPARSRFQRPTGSSARPAISGSSINPSSSSSRGGAFAGSSSGSSRGRGGFSSRGGSSTVGSRGRGSSSAGFSRPGATSSSGSSAGFRGTVSSRFNPRGRSTIAPSATQVTTVKPTTQVSPQEEEYEIIEYEYEDAGSSSTTEAPKSTTATNNRFGGGSRFRLNARLSTPNTPSTTPTSPRITPRNNPLVRRNGFTKPTRPTPTTRGTTAADEEGETAQEVAAPARTTPKPRPSFGNSRGSRTTLAPPTTTTTRRTFAPRVRPSNFPSKGLVRPSPTRASSTEKNEDEDDGELEYEESKHYPSTGNVTAPAAEKAAVAAESAPSAVRVKPPQGFQGGSQPSSVDSQDTEHVDDLVDSGSEFFMNIVPAPYESYEYTADTDENYSDNSRLLRRSRRQVDFASRTRGSLRSNFNKRLSSRQANSRSSPSYSDYDDYYDQPQQPPSTAAPTTSTPRGNNRFRGRIQPTSTSRRTPFTLTNADTPRSPPTSSNTNSRTSSFTRRNQSRYQKPTEAPTTSRSSSRFRSRYRNTEATTAKPVVSSRGRFTSPSRSRGTTTYTDRNRYDTVKDETEPLNSFELGTITVTHYLPAETQIPVKDSLGKVTEYKTILTPSASKEVLAPFQYSRTEYQGSPVLILQSEVTSTPSFGVTEVTKFLIRESSTTSVTFTPTTIRGRKTSFSHIVPSTVYSVEPVVSTVAANPLTDQNQLTNLLLNQLLGNLNINPANLLGLKPQQNNQQLVDPATPVTQYNTKTTSYVTTVTDFTSTILPITLHGKFIKTTIVESSTHVITATEFITESTVISPTPMNVIQAQPTLANGFNPALLQGFLQQQQQLLLQQQQPQLPILPTQPALLPQLLQLQTQAPSNPSIVPNNNNNKEPERQQREESKQIVEQPPVPKKEEYSVVTLYVSGRKPGEFSTILQTVPLDSNKKKRSIDYNDAPIINVKPTRADSYQFVNVVPTQLDSSQVEFELPAGYYSYNDEQNVFNRNSNSNNAYLPQDVEDSYSLSNNPNANNNQMWFKPTQSLDSVLGDMSNLLNSQSVSYA